MGSYQGKTLTHPRLLQLSAESQRLRAQRGELQCGPRFGPLFFCLCVFCLGYFYNYTKKGIKRKPIQTKRQGLDLEVLNKNKKQKEAMFVWDSLMLRQRLPKLLFSLVPSKKGICAFGKENLETDWGTSIPTQTMSSKEDSKDRLVKCTLLYAHTSGVSCSEGTLFGEAVWLERETKRKPTNLWRNYLPSKIPQGSPLRKKKNMASSLWRFASNTSPNLTASNKPLFVTFIETTNNVLIRAY